MLQQHCISPNFHGKMQFSQQPKSAFLLVFACSHGQIQHRGTRSRQKQSKMTVFCLPPTPKRPRADLKVKQILQKLKKCSTPGSKSGPRGPKSRTKSLKIEKMFCRFPSAISTISNIPLTTTTRNIRATPIQTAKNRSTQRHCGSSINFQISALSQAPNFFLAKA